VQEGHALGGTLARQQLGVGEARVVVDRQVHETSGWLGRYLVAAHSQNPDDGGQQIAESSGSGRDDRERDRARVQADAR
jgi:hypothetical protein